MLTELFATMATLLIVSSYIPQIRKGYVTKSLQDVSHSFLIMIVMGVVFWMLYAIMNGDIVFLISNIIVFCLAATLVLMKWYYERGKKNSVDKRRR